MRNVDSYCIRNVKSIQLILVTSVLSLFSLTGYTQNLTVAKDEGRYGYQSNGEWVVQARFSGAKEFREGLAAVEKKAGKWGYINSAGKFVIKAKYTRAGYFNEGLAIVSDAKLGVVFINIEGAVQIKGSYPYAWAAPFEHNVTFASFSLPVNGKDPSNKVLINKNGEVLIDQITGTSDWNQGVMEIQRQTKKDKRATFCYINTSGEIITPLASAPFDILKEPRVIQQINYKDDTSYYYLNNKFEKKGNGICNLKSSVNGFRVFKECLYPSKYGLVDGDLRTVLSPEYDRLGFHNGILIAAKNDTNYIIDVTTKKRSAPYSWISPFMGGGTSIESRTFKNGIGQARVFTDDAVYDQVIIDKSGNVLIDGLWNIGELSEGHYRITRKGPKYQTEYAYIDSVGTIISPWFETSWWEYRPTQYGSNSKRKGVGTMMKLVTGAFIFTDVIGPAFRRKGGLELNKREYFCGGDFNSGRALISSNTQIKSTAKGTLTFTSSGISYGYIDKTGATVIDTKYDKASDFEDGVATVCKGEKCTIIDVNGRPVIKHSFTKIGTFVEGCCPAKGADGCWYFIDKNGDHVFDTCYEQAQSFSKGYAGVQMQGKWGFINRKGEIVLPCKYEAVKPVKFSRAEYFDSEAGYYKKIELGE